MTSILPRTENLLVAYWLTSVGIGPVDSSTEGGSRILPGKQTVKVPVRDVLKYRRTDGSPQGDILVLTGANFTKSEQFERPYLSLEEDLLSILSDGYTIKSLHEAGMKVTLCVVGGHGRYGWQSMPDEKIVDFVDYLQTEFLQRYDLDGIDIDDEYYSGSKSVSTIVEAVQIMRALFPPTTILSKALFQDSQEIIPQIAPLLTYGGIMYYGNNPDFLLSCYERYRHAGLQSSQLLIGVNAGPAKEQPEGNFTSLDTTEILTRWQPKEDEGVKKLGMMIWSFSQDIQQWTSYPQNQEKLAFPNEEDHAWQRRMIKIMEEDNESTSKHLRGSHP